MSLLSHFPNLLRVKTISSEVPESERSLKRVLGPVDLTMLGIGAIVGRGHLCHRRHGGRRQRDAAGSRPSTGGLFHPYRDYLQLRRALLCGARLAGPSLRQRVQLRLRHTGRTGGVDHRLGPGLGIRGRQRDGRRFLVGLLPEPGQSVPALASRAFPRWVVNEFPKWLGSDIRSALDPAAKILESAPHVFGVPIVFNLPAVFIVTAVTAVLVIGVKESARFNTAMVAVKLVVLAFFVIVGAFYINPENLHPFAEQVARHSGGGRRGVFRLHRLRRRFHRGGGMPQPQARLAHRHSRLAGHLHRDLHARGLRA